MELQLATCQLQIATEKCFVCTIANRSQNSTHHVYGVNNHEFAHVNSIRDLGVTIDDHLKFDQHVDLIVHKAMSRAYLVLKTFHSRNESLLVEAYCTYVRPMLEYCSPVWSPHNKCQINKIEKIQRFFIKQFAGLRPLCYDRRLAVLKLHSLEYRRTFNDLVLCYKILNGKLDTELSNFSSLILTRALVVMFSSCANSNVILTAENIPLLIVLLICGTVYRKI